MASLNKVIIMGNLTREVDLRETRSGKPVAELSVALNRKNGEREEVCYIKVVVWGKTAENCRRYLGKGSCVFVEGYLKQESWEDRQTGQKRSSICVVADTVQFISSPRNGDNRSPRPVSGGFTPSQTTYTPTEHDAAKSNGYQPQPEAPHQRPVSDQPPIEDDIPF